MSVFSETIDYSKKTSLHSAYRWIKLTPVGGTGQTVTLSTSSPTIVNFEIPNNVCNLSQSKLVWDILFGTNGVHCMDALGLAQFDRITLSTRSGVILANADNMGQFCHLVSKIKTKISSLVDNPAASGGLQYNLPYAVNPAPTSLVAGAAPSATTSYPLISPLNTVVKLTNKRPFTDICKSNAIPIQFVTRGLSTSVVGVAGPPNVPVNIAVASNNNSNSYRMDGSLISTPLLEPLHVINTSSTLSTNLAASFQLPLSSVKDTLLEVNRSLYFGDNLILSLSFNPATKFSWKSTAGADVVGGNLGTTPVITAGTGPAQFTPCGAYTAAGLVGSASTQDVTPVISNLALYIAVETDPVITSQLISQVNGEGFSMTMPFVYNTKTPISISASGGTVITSSFALQQRITRGYGQRLLRCYSAIFGAEGVAIQNNLTVAVPLPETYADGTLILPAVDTTGAVRTITSWTTNQHNDIPLDSYNTTLDGVRLQDFTLSAKDSTHWLVNEPYLRGSCILNVEQYKNQCLHIDSWTGRSVCEEDDTIDNGLSLDVDRTYGITYTTLNNITNSSQLNHYLFFVVQRTLSIRSNQIGVL